MQYDHRYIHVQTIFEKNCPERPYTITKMNDNINMDSTIAAVSDLHVGLIGWSMDPQNLRGLRPRCIIFLPCYWTFTLMLSQRTVLSKNPSAIFLTHLHSISEYCRILNIPHHLCLYWHWLNTLPSSSSREGWELGGASPHKWISLEPLFI